MPDSDDRITPRELIEMLQKWKQDEVFDVLIQNDPKGGALSSIVVLEQHTNFIRIN
jgi:hypothetical protein